MFELRLLAICWIESVDPIADLCLTNQIYSVLLIEFKEITEVQNTHLKMLLEDGETQTRRCKIFKLSCKMLLEDVTKRDLVVSNTRHHRARLLKYYPRRPCAPGFVKSRTLHPIQTHFLLFQQQIFFVLVCIHPGTSWVPPRVLASGPKPCGGNNKYFINVSSKNLAEGIPHC